MPHHHRVRANQALMTPDQLKLALPVTSEISSFVVNARHDIHRALHGQDDRLLVIVGPCSIHDPEAALDYAHKLAAERQRHTKDLNIVMRVYFEKPRTTVGWKGLINDPHRDGSGDIAHGLQMARQLLLDINALSVPAATEFLDLISPNYVADLVSWGAIGARTTESQVHRELASGLPCPVGFKNGTDGNIKIAIDAMRSASRPHHFLALSPQGLPAIRTTTGNEDCHIILRGGKTPNYDKQSVAAACTEMARAGLDARLMIDASHANSAKQHENQIPVCADIAGQIAAGDQQIMGVMIESNLVAGRQDECGVLTYGQSITDACLGWDDTVQILNGLAKSVSRRRLTVLEPA